MIECYCEGGCLPFNPGGIAVYAFIIKTEDDKVIFEDSGIADWGENASNNLAEFTALTVCLAWLITNKDPSLKTVIKSDSQLLVKLMQGKWQANKDKFYYPKYVLAQALARRFKDLNYEWISREESKEAHKLIQHAYRDFIMTERGKLVLATLGRKRKER